MKFNSYILEQALRQLNFPNNAIQHFQIASALSNIDNKGFPKELFQLSAPMITRGLLNYAVLQMKRDWLFPFWVHKQLDPISDSFVSRSQNPLLLNITHRNWTMIGSPNGLHEAIVDPHGLLTPLPREWSIDVWLTTNQGVLFPSLAENIDQHYNLQSPSIQTRSAIASATLDVQSFTGTTRKELDIVFNKASVRNIGQAILHGWLFVAIRPFNPEGVAPIQSIEFRTPRHFYVNNTIGIVFSQEPDWIFCSNAEQGDSSQIARNSVISTNHIKNKKMITCSTGLANGFAAYKFSFLPDEFLSVYFSTALGTEELLNDMESRLSWRVSYNHRLERHKRAWEHERSLGTRVQIPNMHLQEIFDANILTLLQLHDKEFVSPGPFLYHHFWFRDAAPMLYALDRLGYHERVRQSISSFSEKMTGEGFFKGPEGEWDSNGAALWLIHQHYKLNPSPLWLKHLYPTIRRAARWIIRKRKQSIDSPTTHRGLMPKSLSAEHLGTVDQYYWDTFWSLAGVISAAELARSVGDNEDYEYFLKQTSIFENDIRNSLEKVAKRLGMLLIPATPSRGFDESAIGSICGIYPLQLQSLAEEQFKKTLEQIDTAFIDMKGFYHPIIHSGYNPYLTLQIAHSYLFLGNIQRAWEIAEKIFRQCSSPFSLPEAIHPKTGGGSMGDGHHGWAAAEIILFLLDSIIREDKTSIHLFERCDETFWSSSKLTAVGKPLELKNIISSIGALDLRIEYENDRLLWCTINVSDTHKNERKEIVIHLPFSVHTVVASVPKVLVTVRIENGKTILQCLPGFFTLKIEL